MPVELFTVPGCELRLICDWDVGFGGSVWVAGMQLATYMARQPAALLAGKRVLDLGSGTGIIGLAAKALGAREVCLTDITSHLELLRANAAENELDVQVCELDWTQCREQAPPLGAFDLVLGGDLAYLPELHGALVETLALVLAGGGPEAHALVSISRADTPRSFFDRLEAAGLDYERIPDVEVGSKFSAGDLAVFRIVVDDPGAANK